VESSQATSKVYLEIVKQLRQMIEKDRLKPGDRLPSERELSERLSVGRSSVREALRALELLGLIETRRGEGTFIRDFKDHQLIPLLGTFILQDEISIKDVVETITLIEKDCLTLILDKDIPQEHIRKVINEIMNESVQDDDEFLKKIISLADNYLIFRIWLILKDYYNSLKLGVNKPQKEFYIQLLQALSIKDQEEVYKVYERLRKCRTNADKL